MRKKIAPVDRIARIPSPIGDPARERRIDIAYHAYVLKALRRFDLEGKTEATPRHRIPTSPLSTVDNHATSDRVNPSDTRGSRRSSES
jgi:hypothetical protein